MEKRRGGFSCLLCNKWLMLIRTFRVRTNKDITMTTTILVRCRCDGDVNKDRQANNIESGVWVSNIHYRLQSDAPLIKQTAGA